MAVDLTGDWNTLTIQQVGNEVTATATVPNPHFTVGRGTLAGDVLTMTFTGGAVVQTHTGKVAPNGLAIYWSNNTVWMKRH
jgi:hypothetical protein